MALRALIFAVDGTLANTERDGHRPAYNEAFEEVGLPWHWDQDFYGSLLKKGGGLERLRYYAEQYDPAVHARPDREALFARVHELAARNYQRRLAEGHVPLRSDIGRLICDARTEDVRLAIASSSSEQNIVALLKKHFGPQADHWFEVIASGDSTQAKKPAPDLYKVALAKLGLPPRDCLAVEDSQHGLTASMSAGIPTVVTLSDYHYDEDFDGARLVLHETEELTLDKLRLWHATASTS